MNKILLCKPKMTGREINYIKDALAEDWAVPMGPDVTAFENELRKYFGAQEVVAVNSGTSAMHLALLAAGIEPGNEVMVQSFTFCASCNPIVYAGAQPIFVDSEDKSWNIDPVLLDEAIQDRIAKTGRKPKAIIPVALYGMPYDIEGLLKVSEKYDIPVIEDAAEAFGSRFDGKLLGTFGQFGVLSFNGNKMITTSGGGALICPDKEAKDRITWLATQARENFPYYQHETIGYNYRLSNISACIGRAQLEVADQYLAHHRHVQSLYNKFFEGETGITLHQNPSPRYDSNFWVCTITIDPKIEINHTASDVSNSTSGVSNAFGKTSVDSTGYQPNENIESLRRLLASKGIESRPLWKPMHRQPVYKSAPAYINGVSDSLFSCGLCIPAGPYVTDVDVELIASTILNAIS